MIRISTVSLLPLFFALIVAAPSAIKNNVRMDEHPSGSKKCVTGRSKDAFAFNVGGPSIPGSSFGGENTDYIVGEKGHIHTTSAQISTCTRAGPAGLFRSERYTRASQLVYKIPVPEGTYTVCTLHAETYFNAAGLRKFDIYINGVKRIGDLDVFAKTKKKNTVLALKFKKVKSVKGYITISFQKRVENPMVNAIKIHGPGADSIAHGGSCPTDHKAATSKPMAATPKPMGTSTESKCPKSAIFCEDFEKLSVGKQATNSKWRLEGAAAITDSMSRGKRALHLTPIGGKYGRLMLDNFSPPGNSFYGRLYAYVDKFATGPNYAHFVMAEVLGANSDGEKIRPLGGQYIGEVKGGLSMWGVGSDGGATKDWTSWKESAPTVDKKWTCLEWQMNEKDNRVNVWIDNVSKPELSVSTKNHGGKGDLIFPKFERIWFGWWVFQSGTTPAKFDVYLDDIVLSTARVGC